MALDKRRGFDWARPLGLGSPGALPNLYDLAIFILVPFTFQGALGVNAMLDPGIYDGSGVAKAMASMFGSAGLIYFLMVVLLILALVLSIITAMAGSSRTRPSSRVLVSSSAWRTWKRSAWYSPITGGSLTPVISRPIRISSPKRANGSGG